MLPDWMRTLFIVFFGLFTVSPALAENPASVDRPVPSGKVLTPKGAANPCAAYGPGFVKIEGTSSCVKIGGTLDVGVAVSGRR